MKRSIGTPTSHQDAATQVFANQRIAMLFTGFTLTCECQYNKAVAAKQSIQLMGMIFAAITGHQMVKTAVARRDATTSVALNQLSGVQNNQPET